jgi:hypothetical protein
MMTKVFVDGIEIDLTVWIDTHIARFKDRNAVWAARREALLKEIADYEEVLKNFAAPERHPDAPGEAHTKAYLAALRQTERELMGEVQEPRLS